MSRCGAHERTLAEMLHADVVGSTTLVQRDADRSHSHSPARVHPQRAGDTMKRRLVDAGVPADSP